MNQWRNGHLPAKGHALCLRPSKILPICEGFFCRLACRFNGAALGAAFLETLAVMALGPNQRALLWGLAMSRLIGSSATNSSSRQLAVSWQNSEQLAYKPVAPLVPLGSLQPCKECRPIL